MKQRLKMIEAIKLVLKGIDQTEIESEDGWWETSDSAEFGAKKLAYILGLLAQPEPEPEPVAWMQPDEEHISLWKDDYHTIPLYTTTPQPQNEVRGNLSRKPLTREVIERDFHGRVDFVRQVEAVHGIKE